ncbi:MAG: tetratricopeptide repeat protein [Blastocatellia bacterium]|nr:tetratricopeptide repeat protein [Blastocatellia bacterium]MDW8169058.1 tetratricopeptide repeat protein [Acidobacteriota bacterium]
MRNGHIAIILLLLLIRVGLGASERLQQPTAEARAREEAIAKFEAGQAAHEQGRLTEAIALYTAALEHLPDFPEALYQRAAAYFALDRWEESEKDLLRVLERERELLDDTTAEPTLAAFFARVHTLLAEVLLHRRRLAEAEAHLERAQALDPQFQRVRIVRASLALARKAPDEAIAELNRAAELGPPTAAFYILLGLAEEQKDNPEAALQAYARALALDPNALAAREARSRLLLARKDYARALEDLEVLARVRKTTVAEQRLAEAYALAGRTEDAIALFQQILAREPTHREARELLIALLERTGRTAEALAHAQQLAEMHPQDPKAQALLGELLLPNDPEKAARAFEQAARFDPENLNHRTNLGAALLKLRRFPEAIEVFASVLTRDPNNYPARAGLGTAYFELKDYAQAAREFTWVIERRPETAVAYYFLAICYDRLRDYERALPLYERFLTLADPTKHRTEIESVQFRLPALRRQIEEAKKRRR